MVTARGPWVAKRCWATVRSRARKALISSVERTFGMSSFGGRDGPGKVPNVLEEARKVSVGSDEGARTKADGVEDRGVLGEEALDEGAQAIEAGGGGGRVEAFGA